MCVKTALGIGAFATTLTTLGLALMEWRSVTVTNVFIGNFFFVAGRILESADMKHLRPNDFSLKGIGMVVSAQWELVLGNTYSYTVLSAFGFFYGGFGAIITPLFGVQASYGDDTAGYNNAVGFWILSKSTSIPQAFLTERISVGCMESLFPTWIFAPVSSFLTRGVDTLRLTEIEQFCLYRHLLYSRDGIHISRSILLCCCRW